MESSEYQFCFTMHPLLVRYYCCIFMSCDFFSVRVTNVDLRGHPEMVSYWAAYEVQ